ncbi:MAG: DUF1854 domain-containing protein [Armatimonadota bacterium]
MDPARNTPPAPEMAGVRRLVPESARIWHGDHNLLHCEVDNDRYDGVFAVRLFPIRHPEQFVSLCYTDETDRVREVGVIHDLSEFPEETQSLIRRTLGKHYHERIVERIQRVRLEHGLLFIDAKTDRGTEEFIVPWRHDRAEDYDEAGKVLLDALDNRYVIPDMRGLPERDRLELTRFIYW